MTIERIELDTEQWAVVPMDLMRRVEDYLSTERVSAGEKLYDDVRAAMIAAPRPVPADSDAIKSADIALKFIESGMCSVYPDVAQRHIYVLANIIKQPRPVPTSERIAVDPDALSNYIRLVDGCHVMGAGELAEKIAAWVSENAIVRPAEPDGGAV